MNEISNDFTLIRKYIWQKLTLTVHEKQKRTEEKKW
jgi:hypothetical protein